MAAGVKLSSNPRKPSPMSRKLQKRATRLARKAGHRALQIRRVVREYAEAVQTDNGIKSDGQIEQQREIERAVGRFNAASKELTRLRKKLALKSKQRNG